jgi:hypothetical protein
MKKELVIFVPGARHRWSKKKLFSNIIINFYNFLNKSAGSPNRNPATIWASALKKKHKEVFWLHWSGGVTHIEKWLAVRKLKKIINQYKNTHHIHLIGLSLGGEIVLEVLPKFEKFIKSAILICSTNEKTKFNSKTKIFNIYSPDDSFGQVATKILAPFKGGILLKGKNIKNISLPGMSHENFCLNDIIPSGIYEGKKLSYIITKIMD